MRRTTADEARILDLSKSVVALTAHPEMSAFHFDRLVGECFDWLYNGDGGDGATLEELAEEWSEWRDRLEPREDD